MIAIIPVAGAGTKLRPHTYTQHKSMIPVAGKPVIGYIIEQLIDAGVKEFVFIVGYLGDKIRDYVEKTYPQVKKSYVSQQMREGVGHAVWLAHEVICPEDDVVIVLGDGIIDMNLEKVFQSPYSVLGVKKVDDPRLFGVAEFGEDMVITRLSEKPRIPLSNMALVGLYMIRNYGKLYAALDENIKNGYRTHGEFFLTDGFQKMIEQGEVFLAEKIENWYDCGQKEVMLATNKILLKKLPQNTSNVDGVHKSVLVEPVYIGKNAVVKNSIIGPNVTIGENAVVEYSVVRNSIVGDFVRLKDVILDRSLIGSDSIVQGATQSLSIGDNTDLDLR